jgi:hypothetical protein
MFPLNIFREHFFAEYFSVYNVWDTWIWATWATHCFCHVFFWDSTYTVLSFCEFVLEIHECGQLCVFFRCIFLKQHNSCLWICGRHFNMNNTVFVRGVFRWTVQCCLWVWGRYLDINNTVFVRGVSSWTEQYVYVMLFVLIRERHEYEQMFSWCYFYGIVQCYECFWVCDENSTWMWTTCAFKAVYLCRIAFSAYVHGDT